MLTTKKVCWLAAVFCAAGCAAEVDDGRVLIDTNTPDVVVAPGGAAATPLRGEPGKCTGNTVLIPNGEKGGGVRALEPGLCTAAPDPWEDPEGPAVVDPADGIEPVEDGEPLGEVG